MKLSLGELTMINGIVARINRLQLDEIKPLSTIPRTDPMFTNPESYGYTVNVTERRLENGSQRTITLVRPDGEFFEIPLDVFQYPKNPAPLGPMGPPPPNAPQVSVAA